MAAYIVNASGVQRLSQVLKTNISHILKRTRSASHTEHIQHEYFLRLNMQQLKGPYEKYILKPGMIFILCLFRHDQYRTIRIPSHENKSYNLSQPL